jgi:hypothetical protein
MSFNKSNSLLLSLIASAALTACGGGSTGSNDDRKPDGTTSPTDTEIKTAATQNTTASGGLLIGSDTNREIYDLVADIGDSWQLILDKVNKTYTLFVINTAYDLSDTSAGTRGSFVTKSTQGSRTVYALTPTGGTVTELTTDSSTNSIAGNLTIGGKNATVSGTAFKATDLGKLAGLYNFVRSARNARNGEFQDTGFGQLLISSDGKTGTACLGGVFFASTCTKVVDDVKAESAVFKLAINASGRINFNTEDGTATFGLANLLPSNLGKALMIDQYNTNQEGVKRTGTWYLSEAKSLTSGVFDGQWRCAGSGADNNSITVTGAGVKAKNLSTGSTLDGVFKYNQVPTASGLKNLTGFIAGGASTDALSDYDWFLPLSSTMGINYMPNDNKVRICYKTSN